VVIVVVFLGILLVILRLSICGVLGMSLGRGLGVCGPGRRREVLEEEESAGKEGVFLGNSLGLEVAPSPVLSRG
jgi:hypothetical protein